MTRKVKMIIVVIILVCMTGCIGAVGGLHYERFCKAEGGPTFEDTGDIHYHILRDEFDYKGRQQHHEICKNWLDGYRTWWCEDCGFTPKNQQYFWDLEKTTGQSHFYADKLGDDYKG